MRRRGGGEGAAQLARCATTPPSSWPRMVYAMNGARCSCSASMIAPESYLPHGSHAAKVLALGRRVLAQGRGGVVP